MNLRAPDARARAAARQRHARVALAENRCLCRESSIIFSVSLKTDRLVLARSGCLAQRLR
jgi:hypothetical protein